MNENKEDMKMDIIITETVIREFEKHLVEDEKSPAIESPGSHKIMFIP